MPFTHGNMSAILFIEKVRQLTQTGPVGEREIDLLKKFSVDHAKPSDLEPAHGWTAGRHPFDTDFSCEKNLVGKYLCFAFRVTELKLPTDRIKTLAEIEMIAAEKNGDKLSWEEAKNTAIATVEEESKDGRYDKHHMIPIVWDTEINEFWYGTTSEKWATLFEIHLQKTFGIEVEQLTSSHYNDNLNPPESNPVWMEPESNDWIGNHFMMWLLAKDKLKEHVVRDGIVFMILDKIEMACPDGEKGRDVIATTHPSQSPEVDSAIRDGKLVRKIGMNVLCNGMTVNLTLAAERFAISGAKIESDDELEGDAQLLDRLERCGSVFSTINRMMGVFVSDYEHNMKIVREWQNEKVSA